ncbi:hypothetical protein H5392_09580 [Tessaracoccus sp. MC1865]|nr:hypothetical protein [Tessaracoccus sp. MC1865]MBB1484107.1 hypothetical protein [Tessaracoccus sp. MC1865]QTO37136.1 hypothetical protein J7D54_11945 [Tessaracoccus sp. MC1865]
MSTCSSADLWHSTRSARVNRPGSFRNPETIASACAREISPLFNAAAMSGNRSPRSSASFRQAVA